MSGTINCCPYCESSDYQTRSPRPVGKKPASAHRHYCNACRRGFDTPSTRERRDLIPGYDNRHGLVADLLDADPDSVGDPRYRPDARARGNSGDSQ